ncbi:hypothetical protein [Niabella beijingensis]|uniref:hypothetical protein n=1 Tax=Niabella beijingensis TaxID=2872700 RepID=UPI001CC137F5|nr:hypothetical protein [Niabella beijingensis]MBZ4189483.1 hypothetical protein [Niabella beijingensis]
MKNYALLVAVLLTAVLWAAAQDHRQIAQHRIMKNGVPVIYNIFKTNEDKSQPAYFVNGRYIEGFPGTIDPQMIKSIHVEKDSITAGGKRYKGGIYIEMKPDAPFHLISLAELAKKYTDLNGVPAVFTVNGNLINSDYDRYLIDEMLLLNINVQDLKAAKQQSIKLINIATKTEENIKKSKEIRIRGNDIAQY